MRAEGIAFVTGTAVGDEDGVRAADLHEEFDAVVAAVGATKPRDLPAPGRDLRNIHFAMEFLTSVRASAHAGNKARSQILLLGGCAR